MNPKWEAPRVHAACDNSRCKLQTTVNVVSDIDPELLRRQEPPSSLGFTYSPEPINADWSVVLGVTRSLALPNPRARCFFIATEPPDVMEYDLAALSHYGLVIAGQFRYLRSLSTLSVCTGLLPWRVGIAIEQHHPTVTMSRADFLELPLPTKPTISVVTSDKALTSTQVRRLRLIDFLAKHMPELQVFGRDVRLVNDKADALRMSQFHLALENCRQPRFWTEKLSDPILMGNVTFYSGGNDWRRDFPGESAIFEIDVDHPSRAYRQIRSTLDGFVHEDHFPEILANRTKVLDHANLHSAIERAIAGQSPGAWLPGITHVPAQSQSRLRNRTFGQAVARARRIASPAPDDSHRAGQEL